MAEPQVEQSSPLQDSAALRSAMGAWLVQKLANKLKLKPAEIAEDVEFVELGLDSMTAMTVAGELEEEFDVSVDQSAFWDYPTVGAFVSYLALSDHKESDGDTDLWKQAEAESCLTAEIFRSLKQRTDEWIDCDRAAPQSLVMATHPRGSGTPVFWCGGLARTRHIKREMPGRPVYIMPTGLGIIEHTQGNVQQLAEHYADEVERLRPKGPLVVAGYCFGAQVGLEVARVLKRRGRRIALFVAVEWPGPSRLLWQWHHVKSPFVSSHVRRDSLAVQFVRRHGFAGAIRFVLRKLGERYGMVRRQEAIKFDEPPAANGKKEATGFTTHVEVVEQKAGWGYVPAPLDVPALVIHGQKSELYSMFFRKAGWKGVLCGRLDSIAVPGDHFSMLLDEGRRVLVNEIQERLFRVDERVRRARQARRKAFG